MSQANTEKFKCFTIPLFFDHPIQGSRLGFGENATGVVWTPKMAFLPFAIMAIVNFFPSWNAKNQFPTQQLEASRFFSHYFIIH